MELRCIKSTQSLPRMQHQVCQAVFGQNPCNCSRRRQVGADVQGTNTHNQSTGILMAFLNASLSLKKSQYGQDLKLMTSFEVTRKALEGNFVPKA